MVPLREGKKLASEGYFSMIVCYLPKASILFFLNGPHSWWKEKICRN